MIVSPYTHFSLYNIEVYFNLNRVLYSKDFLVQLYSKCIIEVWAILTYYI